MSFLMDGITQLLNADAGVAAVLSGRLWPDAGPLDQPVYPYCFFRTIPVGGSDQTFDGTESTRKTIQFDIFASTFSDGPNVIQALRNALSTWTGTLPDGTRIISTHRGAEEGNFDQDQRLYHSFAEYEFEFVET